MRKRDPLFSVSQDEEELVKDRSRAFVFAHLDLETGQRLINKPMSSKDD